MTNPSPSEQSQEAAGKIEELLKQLPDETAQPIRQQIAGLLLLNNEQFMLDVNYAQRQIEQAYIEREQSVIGTAIASVLLALDRKTVDLMIYAEGAMKGKLLHAEPIENGVRYTIVEVPNVLQ